MNGLRALASTFAGWYAPMVRSSLLEALGGAFIIEKVFNLPGIGQLATHGVFQDNFPVVMAVTIFGAFLIGVANLIVDIVYAALDPRVRYA